MVLHVLTEERPNNQYFKDLQNYELLIVQREECRRGMYMQRGISLVLKLKGGRGDISHVRDM